MTLFEKQASPGMGAHGFQLNFNGHAVLGDLPSRMFNRSLWPGVARLYDDLGIQYEKVLAEQNFFSVETARSFQFSIPVDWKVKLGIATGVAASPMHRQMQRLQQCATRDLEQGNAGGTFAHYLKRHDFSAEFTSTFLFPALSATVCTCSDKAIGNYPAAILLDAMQKIGTGDGLWRVSAGSSAVVSALLASVDDLCCSTPVVSVTENDASATIRLQDSQLEFDRVIIATQANHVAQLCPELPGSVRQVLASFVYEPVPVIVHTDPRFMPTEKGQWSVFNFQSSSAGSMCSVWLNRFHTQWPDGEPVFQTIKPLFEPASDTIKCAVNLQRPVVTEASYGLWDSIAKINRSGSRIKFCGSYAVEGIPLLESAVVSAHRVCQDLAGG